LNSTAQFKGLKSPRIHCRDYVWGLILGLTTGTMFKCHASCLKEGNICYHFLCASDNSQPTRTEGSLRLILHQEKAICRAGSCR